MGPTARGQEDRGDEDRKGTTKGQGQSLRQSVRIKSGPDYASLVRSSTAIRVISLPEGSKKKYWPPLVPSRNEANA